MIRILFIGRGAPEWSGRIGLAAAGAVETDAAKLPAAGIRRIDERPPDLVVVVAPPSDARLGILLEGIRSRPVGGLAPLLLLSASPPPEDVQELYDLRISDDTSDAQLLEAIRLRLGVVQVARQGVGRILELRHRPRAHHGHEAGLLREHPGSQPVLVHLDSTILRLPDEFRVDAGNGLVAELRELLGANGLVA